MRAGLPEPQQALRTRPTWHEAAPHFEGGEQRPGRDVHPDEDHDHDGFAPGHFTAEGLRDGPVEKETVMTCQADNAGVPDRFLRETLACSSIGFQKQRRDRESARCLMSCLPPHTAHAHVSVVGDSRVGGRGADPREGAHRREDEAAHRSGGEAQVPRVVDEDGRLEHHHEVAHCQVEHENVGRRPQVFRPGSSGVSRAHIKPEPGE